ncbi:MAG TPA: DMT family transporter [Thermoanaerobaculia bacterium]|nr:DMT family transporter [Thermoanaerobaculia bacterium]
MSAPGRLRTALLTLAALCAFAANSILCRLALGAAAIDAASYATVRLAAGAGLLALLAAPRRGRPGARGSWRSAAALAAYAVPFSFAYRTLSAGTGALLLFVAVQATMISTGVVRGERLRLSGWAGVAVALFGLGWLVRPGLSAPPAAGAALMTLAGIAWGVYSLRGRRSEDPISDTAGNFARAVLFAAAASAATLSSAHASARGLALAALSGAAASGAGYAIWYAALPRLAATTAATVQLAVPALAAAGGVVFLGERMTARLLFASAAILGGVALAVAGRGGRTPAASRDGRPGTAERPAS